MGLQLSGSVQLEGNLLVTGSANSVFENISVTNRITANEINVQFVSSSIIYSSGSNRFGDEAGDVHQFTGSVDIKGVGVISGSLGIGVTPVEYSFFDTDTLQIKRAILASDNDFGTVRLSHNINYSANNLRFITSGVRTTMYQQYDGNHYFYTSPAGTAGGAPNFTASLTLFSTGAATFANSVTAGSGLINGTTDAFFDLNRSASGNASRVRFQTTGTDEFEIGLKGGVPGFHITSGDATELLTISGSNVGVGTNTPGAILHTRDASGATRIIVDNNANAAAGAGIYMRTLSGGTMISNATVRTDNAGNFSIFTGTTSDTEAMRITPSGSVGIGTASPGASTKLQVAGMGLFTGGIFNPGDGTPSGVSIGYNTASDYGFIQAVQTLVTNRPLAIQPNGGNVGIGTASPGTILDVQQSNATNMGISFMNTFGATSNTAQTVDIYFKLVGAGITGQVGSMIRTGKEGDYSSGAERDAYMSFSTALNDTRTERMRITSVGDTQPGADNAYSLGVSGTRWSAVWAANGTIQTSDEREKKDIIESDLGLGFITKLRPVSFKWKVGQNVVTSEVVKDEEGNPILDQEGNEKTESVITPREGKRTHYGLIAQEVEDLLDGKDFGGFIHDEETDIKGLRYDQFVPLLIKAIQELKIEIDSLKNQMQ